MLNLSITKRMLLFITVPLVIESAFFFVLYHQFQDLQKELETEARAVEALSLVNRILTGAMTGAANFFTAHAFHQPALVAQALAEFAAVDEQIAELRKLAPADGKSAISGFVTVIDQTQTLFNSTTLDAQEDEFKIEAFKMAGPAKSFLRRIQVAGHKVIDEQTELRKIGRERQRLARANIEDVIKVAAGINLLLAIIAVSIFGLTLGKRFQLVFDNTLRIASNRPLNEPLKGSDELSRLDQVIHEMDRELVITRKRERAIIDNTAEIICSLDHSFRVAEVNSAVRKRLGYEQDDFRGSNFQTHVVEAEKEAVYSALTKSMSGDTEHSFETQLIASDGRIRDMEVTAQWSEHDRGIFCILRDITARKESERLKQEVIAMVSHDLRAPLTSIGMSLDMLVDGIFGGINERGLKVAKVAQQSVTSLIAMINDLLDIERAESAGIQLYYEETNSSALVSRAVEVVKPEAESKQIVIEEECESVDCSLDIERINRVIVNVLNNAIKFAPSDSTIRIICSKLDDQIKFQIADSGPGIPEDKLDSVFEKFRQVGTGSTGERQGSGLGLAICKSLVEAHGGTIGVTSVLGQGSTFWFALPIQPSAANTAASPNL